MATLTVQTIGEAGIVPSYAAAAGGGDVFPDDGSMRTFAHVKNGSGGSITVTATAQSASRRVEGYGTLTRANIAVAIAAGAEKMIGPFAPDAFKNASGNVSLTYSGVTSLTVGVFKLPTV